MSKTQAVADVPGWETFSMYGGKVTLGFDEFGKRTGRRHTYWLKVPRSDKFPKGRQRISGVTGICGILMDAAGGLNKWAANSTIEHLRKSGIEIDDDLAFEATSAHTRKRDLAAQKGTKVHLIVEKLIKGKAIDEEVTKTTLFRHARAVIEKLRDEGYEVLACEIKILSVENTYAGTLDLLVRRIADDARLVLDVKTSRDIRLGHALQIGAYSAALEEEFPDKPKISDGGVILAAATPKIKLLSEVMEMPGREAIERCRDAFLGLVAVKTSIPNYSTFGRARR